MGQASPAPSASFLLVEAAGIKGRHGSGFSISLHQLWEAELSMLPGLSPCKLGTALTSPGHSLLVPHALRVFLRWGWDMGPWEASSFGS